MLKPAFVMVERVGGDAQAQLRRLSALANGSGELLKIDLAVRDWSRRDKTVAARLRRVDNRRMEYMRSLFGALDLDHNEVESRCLLAFSLWIANHFIAADHGDRTRAECSNSPCASSPPRPAPARIMHNPAWPEPVADSPSPRRANSARTRDTADLVPRRGGTEARSPLVGSSPNLSASDARWAWRNSALSVLKGVPSSLEATGGQRNGASMSSEHDSSSDALSIPFLHLSEWHVTAPA